MFFRMVLFVWECVLDLVTVVRKTEDEKGLEIMLLRQQLRIVERKQERGPQSPCWQKVPMAGYTPSECKTIRDRGSRA